MGGDPWDQTPQSTRPQDALSRLDLAAVARGLSSRVARSPRASRIVRGIADGMAQRAQRAADAEAFVPGPGLQLKGSTANQQAFLKMVRREMVFSASFHALMMAMNRDASHPVEVTVSRNRSDVFIDSFDSQFTAGQQEVDLSDLQEFPPNPLTEFPDAVTRGELLAHSMAEARAGAQGDEYAASHEAGIKAQNDYRDDRSQHGHRQDIKLPVNAAGNLEVRYDNGYNEVWVIEKGAIKKIDRHLPYVPPVQSP